MRERPRAAPACVARSIAILLSVGPQEEPANTSVIPPITSSPKCSGTIIELGDSPFPAKSSIRVRSTAARRAG